MNTLFTLKILLKVKVKFFSCLTKLHVMKTCPVFNYALCHEDVWGNGGIAPFILNLGTRWK
jgi:hypothetical protein